tara:strand:- start:9749 stop:10549 length:801 start_codon:yes stop_codon:yes gene_type:complete
MTELVNSSEIASEELLNSKLIALTTEVQSLSADKVLIEQDLDEAKESLEKIQNELKMTLQNVDALQQENKIIKGQLITANKSLINIKGENVKYKNDFDAWEQSKNKILKNKITIESTNDGLQKELALEKTNNAKQIGKLKNVHQTKIEELNRKNAQNEHMLEKQCIDLRAEINGMNNEHKDVVTSQATRLRSYEHQINLLEARCSRLQMTLEFSGKPKAIDLNMEKKLHKLEEERDNHLGKITELENMMSLARVNQHYDFRSKSLF